jgi:hypothetical protein
MYGKKLESTSERIALPLFTWWPRRRVLLGNLGLDEGEHTV